MNATCTHSERRKGVCMKCGRDFNMRTSPTSVRSTSRKPRVFSFTRAQFERWVKGFSGWGTELEGDGGCSAEDAVFDMVEGLVAFPDEGMKRAILYLKKSGVTDVNGRLADDLHEVAHK